MFYNKGLGNTRCGFILSSGRYEVRSCLSSFAGHDGRRKVEFYFRNSIYINLFQHEQQTQIISWPLDTDIVACAEQTVTAASVFAFSSNRINLSSQDPNIVTRATHCRPNMGRSGAPRWPKGSSQAHRYTDRSRVCPLFSQSVRKPF